MTEQQVEQAMQGEYDAVYDIPKPPQPSPKRMWMNLADRTWYIVEFENERVVKVQFGSSKKTPWARFRNWVGLAP